jgi:hypothetical protein
LMTPCAWADRQMRSRVSKWDWPGQRRLSQMRSLCRSWRRAGSREASRHDQAAGMQEGCLWGGGDGIATTRLGQESRIAGAVRET